MFSRILVAVDLGQPELTERALQKCAELARTVSAEVRLVYVRPFMIDAALAYLPPDYFEGEERHSIDELKALVAKAGLDTARTSVVSPSGDVYHLVLAAAEEFEAELVVVGSRRPSMSTYLLGSNAVRIIRHAKTSVLVVR